MFQKRHLPFILIIAVAVGTGVAGTLFYRAKVAESARAQSAAEVLHIAPGTKPGAVPPHIRGRGQVIIEEFADFQCPPCGTVATILHQLEEEYRGRLRIVFRHFPLDGHQHARLAARSAEAAGVQGKFWEMHDLIYQHRTIWSTETDARPHFTRFAETLGLDVVRFTADLDSPEVAARVAADQERGHSVKVSSTPTIFLNDQPVPPASFSPPGFRTLIDAALAAPTPAL